MGIIDELSKIEDMDVYEARCMEDAEIERQQANRAIANADRDLRREQKNKKENFIRELKKRGVNIIEKGEQV